MPRPRVHLVCNAHIDPVWLWEWPEGAGETLSTFRTAADFCESRKGFVFSHNEAILYQWVEEYEPALFARIRNLIRRGRWAVLGGWFLQPDCNMPSGESFVRQTLLGKNYFLDKFGVEVKTAANLDPFGHTRGLVQILAKSGYHSYLFCRPDRSFTGLPADDFRWVGYDGSEILAGRASAHYNSKSGGAGAKVENWMNNNPNRPLSLVLWGIGNHGGGASARDLDEIEALQKLVKKDAAVFHSTAEAYFEELGRDRASLPRCDRDINPWAVGCYTTMVRVKQGHRRLENELYSAEKMASAAAFQGLMKYPRADLAEALRDLAFAEFHDLLPGSSIRPGEEGAWRLLDHGLEICSRVKTKAFFALAAGEPKSAEGEIPIFVYNPHPFAVRTLVECEFQAHEPNFGDGYLRPRIDKSGTSLPAQPEKELSNLRLEWRKRVVFEADLEPSVLNRFSCRLEKTAARPLPCLKPGDGKIRFKTKELDVVINTTTGLIDRFRVNGADILKPGAFQPLVMADNADPWGMSVIGFREIAGRFRRAKPEESGRAAGTENGILPPVRVIEDGEVRSIVESCLVFGPSVLHLRFKLPRRGTEVEVEVRVLWNEKDSLLKLALPTRFRDAEYVGQVAYGRAKLPADGREAVAQKWTAAVSPSKGIAVTVINEGTYGSDCRNGEIRLSLLRSPAHSADPQDGSPLLYQDRFIPRIDQGEHVFRFWINAGRCADRLERIDREALVRNESPAILTYFPPENGPRAGRFAVLNDPAVQITALKRAETGNNLIIRLFEPTGRKRKTVLSLPALGARIRLSFGPFEIKTLSFDPAKKVFEEVDLLERPARFEA